MSTARNHQRPRPTCARCDRKQLPQLAEELRAFLIESVSQTGGHLSSNLGTVELTIALHYVFNTPDDRLVWDVGHQTYAHKILTGRREAHGQPAPAGRHRRLSASAPRANTTLSAPAIPAPRSSAALGMAVAAQRKGSDRRAVAIIGDGAMTAGMAFEALNNAGAMDANLLVMLNDNDMSISANVGALNNYLAKLMSGRFYAAARRAGEKVLGGDAADSGTGQARRGAREGHGDARHPVRGIRLQLHRPDRRPRPRCAGRPR